MPAVSSKGVRWGKIALLTLAVALLAPTPVHAARKTDNTARLDASLATVMRRAGNIPVVVQYESRPTATDAAALREAGFRPGFVRYRVVDAVHAVGSADAIRRIARNPRVTYIEHDRKVTLTLDRAARATRAREAWDAQYKLLDAVHSGGITGRGVSVAVIDTGVDATHPDLLWKPLAEQTGREAKTIANLKIAGRDSIQIADAFGLGPFVEAHTLGVDMPNTDNTGGHGTHVAGSVAGNGTAGGGKYKGAAPGASIVGLGAGEGLSISLGLAALDWVHQHHDEYGIRVVTNSWGGAGDWEEDLSVTKAARRLVNEDGLVVLFAAGNDGGNGTAIETSLWANIPEVISVANYYDRTGWVNTSSSRGLKSVERTWPDFAAPGTQIISTNATAGPVTYFGTAQDAAVAGLEGQPDEWMVPIHGPASASVQTGGRDVVAGNYSSMTGTSMATPYVAGIVALLLEANPSLDPFTVREILRATANMPKGRTYASDGFAIGTGVVDAAEAVAVALRMREGASLYDALRTAYVDYSTSPARINQTLPRRLEFVTPKEGQRLSGEKRVRGAYYAGALTDDSIPLAPSVSRITGNPRMYVGGALDPFVAGGHTLVPGAPVSLSVRSISAEAALVAEGFTVKHQITQNGRVVYGPFDAPLRADGTGLFRSDSTWTVPMDAPLGNYSFDSIVISSSGAKTRGTSRPFSIGATTGEPSSSAPDAGSTAAAPSGTTPIEVRVNGGAWSQAGVAGAENSTFSFVLDLTTLPKGPALLEARTTDARGRTIVARRSFIVE